MSYVDSLDCVGVLSTSVDNVQQVFGDSSSPDEASHAKYPLQLDVLSHPNENDMSCATRFTQARSSSILQNNLHHYSTFPSLPLTGLRIGLPVQDRLPAPNVQTPPRLLKHLESLGATLHPVDIPTIHVALPAYYVLASAEASSNLARYGGGWFGSPKEREQNKEGESGEERRRRSRTEGFGREVKKRLLAGTYALSAEWVNEKCSPRPTEDKCSAFNNTYLKALHLRRLLRQQMSSLFRIPNPLNPNLSSASEGVDILLHPTAIRTAPRHDEAKEANGESEYLQDYLTVPASLAGLPAMSVPAGRGADGWPVGVSLVSQWGMENILFWAGRGIESWSTEA